MNSTFKLCTLEVGIGNCHLNLKTQGLFAVSLQMGKHTSQISPKKPILNDTLSFNTTLRMNIDKQLLQQQPNPKCRILLHLYRQNRQKQVIGVATIDINAENNKGFRYHEMGQCADGEADIEVSVNCERGFGRAVRSEVGYDLTSQLRLYEKNDDIDVQVGGDYFEDSINLDDSELNIMNRSKAVSNIEWISPSAVTNPRPSRPKNPSINLKPKRSSTSKPLRKPTPPNLISCTPQQIITHYETELKTFQDQLRSRQEWANGMKMVIQQLQAQNQLLKEIKIEQLQQHNIHNLQQGIDYVSKLVHSKFSASKSITYNSQSDISLIDNTSSRQRIDQELKLQLEGTIISESNVQESERQIGQSSEVMVDVPKITVSPRMGSPLKKRKDVGVGEVVGESKQELQHALTTFLTSQPITTQQQQPPTSSLLTRITQLQQTLLHIRSQKQQLQQMTQQLYQQLTTTKSERDSFYDEIQLLGKEIEQITKVMDELKEENEELKALCKGYEMGAGQQEDLDNFVREINRLEEMNVELERRLRESVNAIDEFRNDAISARSELIVKDQQLKQYKVRYGELDVLSQGKISKNNRSEQKLFSFKDSAVIIPNETNPPTTITTTNLHSVYIQLLETTIAQRKDLQQQSLMSINTPIEPLSDTHSKANLKRVQVQVNKLFIEIFKNNAHLKNVKQIEIIKKELSAQIDNIISTS